MKLGSLQHFTIRAAKDKFAAIERFYAEVLGLKSGFRPAFEFDGLWLYHGERAVLHVALRSDAPGIGDVEAGVIDHVAFSASDAVGFPERLRGLGIPFDEQNVTSAGYQIFLRDPVGTKIEINFPNAEAPE